MQERVIKSSTLSLRKTNTVLMYHPYPPDVIIIVIKWSIVIWINVGISWILLIYFWALRKRIRSCCITDVLPSYRILAIGLCPVFICRENLRRFGDFTDCFTATVPDFVACERQTFLSLSGDEREKTSAYRRLQILATYENSTRRYPRSFVLVTGTTKSGESGASLFSRCVPDCDHWRSFPINENSNLYRRGNRQWISLLTNPLNIPAPVPLSRKFQFLTHFPFPDKLNIGRIWDSLVACIQYKSGTVGKK